MSNMENTEVNQHAENASLERFVAKFGNVIVGCAAGKSTLEMPIADFSQTEMGQKYLGAMANGFDTLTESGMDAEPALTIVAGAALIRDEDNRIKGLEEQPVLQEALESKKK